MKRIFKWTKTNFIPVPFLFIALLIKASNDEKMARSFLRSNC
jgi:hypothetical protein